jgi:hypothetical protein
VQDKQVPCETDEGKVKPAVHEVQIESLIQLEQIEEQVEHIVPFIKYPGLQIEQACGLFWRH